MLAGYEVLFYAWPPGKDQRPQLKAGVRVGYLEVICVEATALGRVG